ncbi:DUF4318 domain-containing protein [Bacillus sp. S13(2024)]|uniref:DUF4318 domain-containing protein n=1 Tax=unclassified Bacillus (in: firmicutes) TaxID=185979 RepID=UPI003D1F8BFD
MKIEKEFLKRFFKKGFFIELDETLTYPSAQTICESIEKYAAESKEKVEFTNKVKPVTFYLDDTLYQANIRIVRGGYEIFCKEV